MILTSLGNIVPDLVPPPLTPHLSSLSCCQSGHLYTSVQYLSLTKKSKRKGRDRHQEWMWGASERNDWPERKNMRGGGREKDNERINGKTKKEKIRLTHSHLSGFSSSLSSWSWGWMKCEVQPNARVCQRSRGYPLSFLISLFYSLPSSASGLSDRDGPLCSLTTRRDYVWKWTGQMQPNTF